MNYVLFKWIFCLRNILGNFFSNNSIFNHFVTLQFFVALKQWHLWIFRTTIGDSKILSFAYRRNFAYIYLKIDFKISMKVPILNNHNYVLLSQWQCASDHLWKIALHPTKTNKLKVFKLSSNTEIFGERT